MQREMIPFEGIGGSSTTNRPTNPCMEYEMEQVTKVLDHGLIRVVDYMGDEDAILDMARVSYGHGTKSKNDDIGLLRYLMRHRHTSPFEGCEIKLHVKLPIFVMRQWVRHRTASLNEVSARYSILPSEFYLPSPEVLGVQAKNNKQGRAEAVTPEQAELVLRIMRYEAQMQFSNYHVLVDGKQQPGSILTGDACELADDPEFDGIAKELARIGLPVSAYTEMYWKIDLKNLLGFLSLRAEGHAQWEIRQYAEAILDILKGWMPNVYQAFMDYQFNAVHLSGPAKAVIADLLRSRLSTNEELVLHLKQTAGLSDREARETVVALLG